LFDLAKGEKEKKTGKMTSCLLAGEEYREENNMYF